MAANDQLELARWVCDKAREAGAAAARVGVSRSHRSRLEYRERKVETRGSTIIKAGVVHRKAPRTYRCPICGKKLQPDTVTVRFVHAPPESSAQRVPGYRCECGEEWPDPQEIRNAYRAAFRI